MLKRMVRGLGGPKNPAQTRTNSAPHRPFLPPSHYARAAGIGIPSVPQEPRCPGINDDTYENGFLPVSYLTGAHTSDSSMDTGEKRFSLLCRRKSSPVSRSNSNSSRAGRITGLPQLEREILPSLKDTIDRMTRPPSVVLPTSPQSPFAQDSVAPGTREPHRLFGLAAEVQSSKVAASVGSSKGPPKSALRSPTPRLHFKSDQSSSSTPAPGPSKLQKSSCLEKHNGSPVRSPTEKYQGYTRQRSTTDPGVGPLRHHSNHDSDFSTPQVKSSKQCSQIPRPSGKSIFTCRMPSVNIHQSSDRLSQDTEDEGSLASSTGNGISSGSRNMGTAVRKDTRRRVGLGLRTEPEQVSDGLSEAGRQWVSLRKANSRIRCNPTPPPTSSHGKKPHPPAKWSSISREQASVETDASNSHWRRHADLLGLVSNIAAGQSSHLLVHHNPESDYYGEDGLVMCAPRSVYIPDNQPGRSYDDSIYEEEAQVDPNPSTYSQKRSPEQTKYGHLSVTPPSPITRGVGRIGSTPRDRSASRSPIVHQPNVPMIPSALKQHSVYQSVSPNTVGYSPTRQEERALQYTVHVDLTRMPDAFEVASTASAIANRERASLGLPKSSPEHQGSEPISHTEGRLSALERAAWQESTQELSSGAEMLLRKLENQPALSYHKLNQGIAQDARTCAPIPDPTESTFSTRGVTPRYLVIQEVIQTEESFSEALELFVRLYILPLRVQNSRTWISGVPTEVSSLFDWYEDITNIHHQLLDYMRDFQKSYLDDRFAEYLRPVVSSLEVYQPYLVRLADILRKINRRLQDPEDDFGEFIRIQESASKRNRQRIEPLLRQPLDRLEKYPELFKRLLNATPKSHPDYLSTFSLYHSTDLAIRVLMEVKNREEEYTLIKQLSARIWRLPRSAQLAQRERRLLLQGALSLQPSDWKASDVPRRGLSQPTPDEFYSARLSNRSSRLVDAVNEWSTRRERSGSVASTNTGASFSSYSSASSSSSSGFSVPRTPTTPQYLSRSLPGFHHPRLPVSPTARDTADAPPVQVFVFTDLVILADPVPGNSRDEWTLHEQPGLARILEVTENPNDLDTLTLDILALKPEDVNNTINFDDVVVQQIHLKLPGHDQVTNGTRESWLAAFRSCLRSTLQLAALPGYREAHIGEVSTEMKGTVLSLLASGLPLPKSPSMQQAEYHSGEPQENARQEREQRGWWALRFHQVLQEFLHRGDAFAL
ncbi:hypothetical protein BDN72DRAFT_828038 [Pluteus cervinus]|uniref:Uncharacterized protein n=1 Tax=Pluteus cervinus TaxID=181527 RepID=A0ACD3A7W0_9AGAR|nr:hypothetical protein BDN72DRAFT_828038 [Pluteus cervinus]